MTRLLGTVITERDSVSPRTPPTDTGTAFMVGLTEQGPAGVPTPVRSLQETRSIFGNRVSYSQLMDAIEVAFAEGASLVYVLRRVGPAAAQAEKVLKDGSNADSLTVKAKYPGEYGNALKVGVEVQGSTFSILVTDANGDTLEQSPFYSAKSEAVAWAANSRYIVLEAEAGGIPAQIVPASLTGGTDDRMAISDSTLVDELAAISKQLGPGQIAAPGMTTATAQRALLTHARDFNRRAVLDAPDSGDSATLKTAAAAVRSLGELAKYGAMFAGWVEIGGVIPGTTRVVPPSGAVIGRIAAVDAKGNPNRAAAGDEGIFATVLGLTQSFTDDQIDELAEAGVNCLVDFYDQPRIYGFRTVAAPTAYPLHYQFANVRLDMAIYAKADAIIQRYVFRPIDGQGLVFGELAAELAAMLQRYADPTVRALYGSDDDPAYRVDTSSAVNTPESIAAGKIRAVIGIRRSPTAELVELEVVRVRVTDPA